MSTRISGNTTRKVDDAIQCLFTKKAIFIPIDRKFKNIYEPLRGTEFHPYLKGNKNITFIDEEADYIYQSHFLKVLLRRLQFEHYLYLEGPLPLNKIIYLENFKKGTNRIKDLNWLQRIKLYFK